MAASPRSSRAGRVRASSFTDLHRGPVVLVALVVEHLAMAGPGVERQDHLDPVEGLLQHFVDPGHALHHPPAGPLEEHAELVDRQPQERHEQQREERQPPVDDQGPDHAGEALERLADQLSGEER